MPSDMEFRHMILGTICSGDRAFKQLRCKPFRKRRKVFEIYATSIDYDPSAEVSIQFFKNATDALNSTYCKLKRQRSVGKSIKVHYLRNLL